MLSLATVSAPQAPCLSPCLSLIETYTTELKLRGLSLEYIAKLGPFLSRYVTSVPEVSAASAKRFLAQYSTRKPNTRARYTTYLRSFLAFHGIPLDLKVKVPRSLPPFVESSEIDALLRRIGEKQTHKGTQFRDIVLVETALKTGMRRGELANLRPMDIDFSNSRLKVINGKGSKDRVIPLQPAIRDKLQTLCSGKAADARVFGMKPRSLGMKINVWTRKANVPQLHTHSFRHHFATTLVDRGANIRAVQELMGHANLNTTQVYLAVTGRHLEDAISLL